MYYNYQVKWIRKKMNENLVVAAHQELRTLNKILLLIPTLHFLQNLCKRCNFTVCEAGDA